MTLHDLGRLGGALLLAGVAAGAFAQGAEPWPQRQVRIVVPYVAGAMGDVVTRRLAEGVRAELGQPVVVDNRPGAGGNIGTRAVEQAPADGYTVLVAATNNFTINQFLYKDLGFDPLRRFEPVTVLVDVPSVLFVPASVPAQSFRDFVGFARANPGKVNYGSPGSGTTPHLSAEAINKAHALGMTHVPYKGASQVVTALLGGEVQFYLAGAGVGAAHVKAGKLRALAVAARTRLEALPEVPTFAEAGLGGINASNWWGVAVPAGTPKPVVERLHAALCKALADPPTRAAMVQMGNVPVCNTPAEMQRQLAEEAAAWQRTLPGLAVKVD
ncbi:MAG: tripartite tricarboxylate transporter substrate binding protein [Burkholderiales bacterium]|nr:tripartite tricarboxylate transporter substrate binding protein [Burkholderiales bacterium]